MLVREAGGDVGELPDDAAGERLVGKDHDVAAPGEGARRRDHRRAQPSGQREAQQLIVEHALLVGREHQRLADAVEVARADDLDVEKLERISREVGLDEAIPLAASLLDGAVRGRVIVDVNR